ncbi:carnitine O-palmitoyltransferase 2, mitochondrial [Coccinella septempunctata]|uniref:carnitine O-palmitoyltransferase 2, mitochondrial n=1 Tax=Coccinella septempunctata TaxID=41139 RepID=UPI001D0926D6|nr:carnitine O-palmitoyltransferase 2, mitochondrial [Coccinella septempunctata]
MSLLSRKNVHLILKNKTARQKICALQLSEKSSDKDYQYLQFSKIPTLHFQKSLPRLPIPKLSATCDRYLAAQRPLLIDESFRKTEFNVKRFCASTGQQLQKYLQEYDRANKHTSYISEMWFDMYLRDRQPLPLNYNPILVLHNDPNKDMNDQLVKTTNLVISSLRFYKSLEANILEPEVFHLYPKKSDTARFRNICSKLPEAFSWYGAYMFNAYPLDMSQYSSLFKSTRIPETDKDRLVSQANSSHITVQHKGHFYVVNVLSDTNSILPADVILARLQAILNDNVTEAEYPIGPLTTLNRDKWATIRHELIDAGNESKIKLIDTALFHVCLDNEEVLGDPVRTTRQFLHADATNRWFDKSFSLIVTKDGYSGVNFEHAWGDGVAVLRYMQEIYKDTKEKPQVNKDTKIVHENNTELIRLELNLSDNLKNEIHKAMTNYKNLCSSLDVNYLIFDGIGKNVCKRESVSPDAVMQLSFQVAYHKLTGKFVPSYESCSTAAFKHGRTETIRPCTVATKDMALALNSKLSKASPQELKQMLAKCSQYHSQLTKEAAMGQGFDRHLFALKHFAAKNKLDCNIFHDPEYTMMNHNILSTSTLNSPAVMAGGFGPVVKDGLGVGYMILDDACGAIVTNYLATANGKGFIEALKSSLEDILKVLNHKR